MNHCLVICYCVAESTTCTHLHSTVSKLQLITTEQFPATCSSQSQYRPILLRAGLRPSLCSAAKLLNSTQHCTENAQILHTDNYHVGILQFHIHN